MAEAPRNTKLPSGFDEEFVYDVEDDFLCLICQLPLKEPVLTRCGHRFCNACLEEHLRRYALATEFYLMLSITLIRHPQSKVRTPALRSGKHPDFSSAKNRTSFTEADDTLTLVDLLVEDNGIQVLLAKSFQ